MNTYNSKLETIIERTSAAMYAFWSAMLTAHTVFLSVAVALPSVIPSAKLWQFKLVGILATICIFVLLFNFAMVRMQYEIIGKRLINYEAEVKETERNKDITSANRRNLAMRIAEIIAILCLLAEACLLTSVL